MTVYTHFRVSHGEVNLLAGDVTACEACGRLLYRDWRVISPSHPDPSGAVNTAEAYIELGRELLPEDAEAAEEGVRLCGNCTKRATQCE